MRLIPVMDLRNGLAVHAMKGDREHYQPVTSVLTETADPLTVAAAFRDKLGLSQLYIADLDAIQRQGHHRVLISRLAQHSGMQLIVDAGASDVASALQVLDTGASQVIIGSETLMTWETLLTIRDAISGHRLIFSLDMRAGQILSRCPQLTTSTPVEVLGRLSQAGYQEVILLDLARVGTKAGINRTLIAEARQYCPELTLIAGGGIRDAHELDDLKTTGIAGVLVATALHRGIITRQHIAALMAGEPNPP